MPPKRVKKAKKQSGKGVGDALSKINQIARDTKILSTALNVLAPNSSIAQGVSSAASQLGYGRKKPRKQRGRGLLDSLGSVLGSVGHSVGSAGYGLLSGLTARSRGQLSINPMMIR